MDNVKMFWCYNWNVSKALLLECTITFGCKVLASRASFFFDNVDLSSVSIVIVIELHSMPRDFALLFFEQNKIKSFPRLGNFWDRIGGEKNLRNFLTKLISRELFRNCWEKSNFWLANTRIEIITFIK